MGNHLNKHNPLIFRCDSSRIADLSPFVPEINPPPQSTAIDFSLGLYRKERMTATIYYPLQVEEEKLYTASSSYHSPSLAKGQLRNCMRRVVCSVSEYADCCCDKITDCVLFFLSVLCMSQNPFHTR